MFSSVTDGCRNTYVFTPSEPCSRTMLLTPLGDRVLTWPQTQPLVKSAGGRPDFCPLQKRCHTASLFCCQSQRPAKCACLHVNSLKPQIQLLDLTTHISAVSCHRVWWVATTLDKNKTLWSLPPVLRGSVAKVVEALWGHQALSFQISSSYHFT